MKGIMKMMSGADGAQTFPYPCKISPELQEMLAKELELGVNVSVGETQRIYLCVDYTVFDLYTDVDEYCLMMADATDMTAEEIIEELYACAAWGSDEPRPDENGYARLVLLIENARTPQLPRDRVPQPDERFKTPFGVVKKFGDFDAADLGAVIAERKQS